jgi:hypothetical protein
MKLQTLSPMLHAKIFYAKQVTPRYCLFGVAKIHLQQVIFFYQFFYGTNIEFFY